MTRFTHSRRALGCVALAACLSLSPRVAAQPQADVATPQDAPAPSDLQTRLARELAVGSGLTSDEVARHALATSFDVRGRHAELLAAAAAVDQAAAAFVPRVTATARYTRLSDERGGGAGNLVAAPSAAPGPIPPGAPLVNVPLDFDQPLNQYLFQASLVVPISDYVLRVARRRAAAEHGEKAAQLTERAARRNAQTQARLAYYGWVRARLDVVVAEQAAAQARAHLNDVTQAADAGNSTRADVLAVEAQLAQSELFLARAESLAGVTEERLRTLLHERAPRELRIGEDVLADASYVAPARLETLWAEARRRRPELRAVSARARSLEEEASVERAGYLPRLEGFANAYYSNPNSRVFPQRDEFRSSWDIGAQLTWTLSDIPGASAATRGAEARQAALLADRAALEDSVRNEVAEAREALREAAAAISASGRSLTSAEEAYRVRRTLFQYGRATSVELSDAETELTRVRLEAVRAKVDLRVAQVRLLHATGRS